MDEELELIKKLEALELQHKELDRAIQERNGNEFELARLKKEKLNLKDEICKLSDAIYPDIIA